MVQNLAHSNKLWLYDRSKVIFCCGQCLLSKFNFSLSTTNLPLEILNDS